MNVWEDKKYKAIKDNNVVLYNAMNSYEKYGVVGILIDGIGSLIKQNKEQQNEILRLETETELMMLR